MKRRGAPAPGLRLDYVFDQARFGPERTLNVRTSLPTVEVAVARAEKWLRQRQVDRAGEVLIITGRGKGSEGGVPLVRQGVIRLLHSLRRQGVITAFSEHTPGSLVVELASVRALFERPRRSGSRGPNTKPLDPDLLKGLDPETSALLRELARRTLEELGVHDTESFLADEMIRQFSMLARSRGSVTDGEELREMLRSALRD